MGLQLWATVFIANDVGICSYCAQTRSTYSYDDHFEQIETHAHSIWLGIWYTRKFLVEEFQRLGIAVSFADPTRTDGWKRHIKRTTRAVFVETPTNPQIRLIDLDPIAELCNSKGLHLLVDSSIASPINFRPLEHGADIDAIDDEFHGTPLAWAAAEGHEETVRLLLEHGANRELPENPTQARPAARARAEGHSKIVKLLEQVAAGGR